MTIYCTFINIRFSQFSFFHPQIGVTSSAPIQMHPKFPICGKELMPEETPSIQILFSDEFKARLRTLAKTLGIASNCRKQNRNTELIQIDRLQMLTSPVQKRSFFPLAHLLRNGATAIRDRKRAIGNHCHSRCRRFRPWVSVPQVLNKP